MKTIKFCFLRGDRKGFTPVRLTGIELPGQCAFCKNPEYYGMYDTVTGLPMCSVISGYSAGTIQLFAVRHSALYKTDKPWRKKIHAQRKACVKLISEV